MRSLSIKWVAEAGDGIKINPPPSSDIKNGTVSFFSLSMILKD
jgi:hypothetical protein